VEALPGLVQRIGITSGVGTQVWYVV